MRRSDRSELSDGELIALVERVFRPRPEEHRLLVLSDLPDAARPDHPAWATRRDLALDWARRLAARGTPRGMKVRLALYRNVRANNADLPARAFIQPLAAALPATADALGEMPSMAFDQLLANSDLVLAPTELSTTAPLKLAARRHHLRAATMPGFSPAMVAALRLDFDEIDRRVRALAAWLERATGARLRFIVDRDEQHELFLDLRFRRAHASGGLLTEPDSAGNLPSGEAYIVPYEGERAGEPSASQGTLPVELDGGVVRYQIAGNRALAAVGDEPMAAEESRRLRQDPAYGNLAEFGLGVLAAFGVHPIGVILLDEKLGPHLAFGRSDHFGGQVGPADFSQPQRVVHIDRVYLPETQPRVSLDAIDLHLDDVAIEPLWRRDNYVPGIFDRAPT